MAISQKRYIDITSGVGGQPAAAERELIARLLTTNPLASYGSVMEFTSLDNVGLQFGTNSAEYAFAVKYFGFVSKNITSPGKLSISRYSKTAIAPAITGTRTLPSLTQLKSVTGGTLTVNLGGVTKTMTQINFSSATTLADVASLIENKINAETTGGGLWTDATVLYEVNSATGNGCFILTGGETGESEIGYASGDVANLLGWDIAGDPVLAQGSDGESPVEAVIRTSDISNNYGTFAFVERLTLEEITEIAQWVNSANVQFLYSVPVTAANYAEISAAVDGMNGVCLTLEPGVTHAEYMPMAVLAATNYDRPNATNNFMFQTFPGEKASVTTDAAADRYDAAKVNYYGATQSAGKQLAFYQRGVLTGSIQDIGVYANEMWLKDAMIVAFFNLLLAVSKVPANADGEAMCRAVMIDVINRALNNGTIIPLKALTANQKVYIYNLTRDETAWYDVFNNGYKLYTTISEKEINGTVNYVLDYTLIYAKGDAIKKVTGSHVMI